MKILIIGDVNSKFIRDYAKSLKAHFRNPIFIDLFTTFPPKDRSQDEYFNKIWDFPDIAIFKNKRQSRPIIRTVWLFWFLIRNGKKYTHIHIQYVLIDFIFIGWFFRQINNNLIVTIYGSDFYNISTFSKHLLGGLFKNAKAITFSNQKTAKDFLNFYHKISERKIHICLFGLSPLEEIKLLKDERKEAVRHILDLPVDKVVVCLGYNYSENQQHLRMLEVIENDLSLRKYINNLFFILPLTYGNKEQYRDDVLQRLKTFPFPFRTFTVFLDELSIAGLRLSCDIMIQVQKTDQLSGAMLEHLFAGNVVIVGSWLPYDVLDRKGIYLRKISEVDTLNIELSYCLEHLADEKQKSIINAEPVYQMASWTKTIQFWSKLYQA